MHRTAANDSKRIDGIEDFIARDGSITKMTLETVVCVARACDGIISIGGLRNKGCALQSSACSSRLILISQRSAVQPHQPGFVVSSVRPPWATGARLSKKSPRR